MLKQKFFLHFLSGVGTQLITMLAGIFVARIAGPEVIGTVAYGVAFVTMFGVFLGIFSTAHIKMISEGENIGNCNKTYFTIQSINIVIYIFIFIIGFIIYYVESPSSFDGVKIYVIILYFFYNVLLQYVEIMRLSFFAKIEIAKVTIPDIIQSISYNISRIIAALKGLGAIGLTICNYIGLFFYAPFIYKYYKKFPYGNFDRRLLKKYFSISLFIIIILISDNVYSKISRVFLENYTSTRDLGLYTAGMSISSILLWFSNATGNIFFPYFSRLISENYFSEINNKIEKYERFIFIFFLPLILVISIFSKPIIVFLLGKVYEPSSKILSILILASFLQIFSMPRGNLIAGKGLFKLTSFYRIVQTIFFIFLLILLISPVGFKFGIVGMAIAIFMYHFLECLLFFIYTHYQLKVKTIKKNYFILIINIVYFSVIYYIYITYFKIYEHSELIMLIFLLLVLGIFYIILLISRIVHFEDFKFLLSFFSISSLKNYVRDELKDD